MNGRAILAFLLLCSLTGCTGLFGPGEIPAEDLEGNVSYDWNTTTAAHIETEVNGSYRAIYVVNESTIELYKYNWLHNRRPLRIERLRYRHPNGTIISGANLSVSVKERFTVVEVPVDDGKIGFVAESGHAKFGAPVLVNGSYTVVLPPNRSVGNPLFGKVRPGSHDIERKGDQLYITWENRPRNEILIQHYNPQHVRYFGIFVIAIVLIGIGALTIVYRQLQERRAEREAISRD